MQVKVIDKPVFSLSKTELANLNEEYKNLHFKERLLKFYESFPSKNVLVTSSFAATSAYFLHIISSINPEQIIHFIDTGFHFEETLNYKNYLSRIYDLKVIDLKADAYQHAFSLKEKLFESDPDFCCTINKINPLENIKSNYDFWISSLMSWQTENRAGLSIFEERRGIIKFNPMIDVTKDERAEYILSHDLPFHPLVTEGYSSIGCSHCTIKGEDRCGRWNGKPKTECGLHL